MSIPSNFLLFFYYKILAIIISIPPTFPALMPFPVQKYYKHLAIEEKKGVSERGVPAQKLKKRTAIFILNLFNWRIYARLLSTVY